MGFGAQFPKGKLVLKLTLNKLFLYASGRGATSGMFKVKYG
jgi:hypothetical protein